MIKQVNAKISKNLKTKKLNCLIKIIIANF